ncbi:MAG TPA: hypothetical protein VFN66_07005 [Burkholderiales bacterium]|nr:hypothetical protein [Burkholderiales bacterium]
MLAAILFMQYSLASQACMLADAHPAMAFAVQATTDCAMRDMDKPNPNACFVHCTASDQTLDTHHSALDPAAILPVTTLMIASSQASFITRIYSSPLLFSSGGPPLYLLLQNFRN